MIDRRLIENFDWGLLALTLLLAVIGMTALFSAVTAGEADPDRAVYIKQLIWFGIAFTIMLFSLFFSYRVLERWAFPVYLVCVGMLVTVLLFGTSGGGSRRWLILGPFSVQPSEMVKISVIILLAQYYSKHADSRGFDARGLVTPFVIIMVPFALIVRQPDLGTAMVMALIAGSMTLYVKIQRRTLFWLGASCMVAGPMIWFLLKGYQKQRILTFLDPDRDPLGAGYHIIQSKIAIGSGMLTGKGYLRGTQNALSFIPEQHTDFIFSVLAEEWGFAGSVFLLMTFMLLLLWGIKIAYGCRDSFGTILAFGVTTMIFWQVFINIGMVMGLMPVVGVPLPFISRGGSSLVTIMICVGILLNISMRRYAHE
jgi:rod shape determining protein RodA